MNFNFLNHAKDKFLTYIANNYTQDNSKFLLHAGAIGWILSSIAQIGGILFNKKVDRDKKNFLLLQEAADGAVNVGLYYALTASVMHLAKKLAENKIVFKELAKFSIKDQKIGFVTTASFGAQIISCNIITPYIRNAIASSKRKDDIQLHYTNFRKNLPRNHITSMKI